MNYLLHFLKNTKAHEGIPTESFTTKSLTKPAMIQPHNPADRKFNIVIYGIKESPTKTNKHICLEQDLYQM